MLLELLAANLVICLAALLQAATGAGYAMVAVPVLALIDLAWVPAPMLISNLALSAVMMRRGRAALERAELPPLALGLVLGTAVGAGLLAAIAGRGLGGLIGGIIVAAVLASLVTPALRITRARVFCGAVVGGATGVIAAMHGPPLILLYQREHPEKVRATLAGVFLFGSVLALGALWAAGLLGAGDLWRGAALLPGVGLGFVAGRALAGRLSRRVVRGAMLSVAGVAGMTLLIRAL
ncbi:MAG TPA: sulfite exporter TauE/SafE family protein [Thermohalobaculum sp.]|nr:sulfite exporter TauE/SafE family protein [Thermohalobaculum sp.]